VSAAPQGSAPETVLVTGATGFIGRHLCRALAADGARVRALVRDPAAPLDPGVEAAPVAGLHDRDGLRRAAAGCGAVVHLAARVHVMHDTAADPLAEFRRVNVEGTETLLDAAWEEGVRRFVYASSVKAVGERSGAPWTEEVEPAPVDPYGISKLEAERLVRARAVERGMHAPVLRFPLVYGPGVGANMLQLFRLVDRGVPLPLGAVRNRRSLAYVGNVAAAVQAVLATPAAAHETFFVADGPALSTPELVRAIAAALGRPARLVPVPPALLRVMGRAGDALGVRAMSSDVVQRLLDSLALDPSKLARVTGRRPPFTPARGLEATAAWYRNARGAK
jgi:nucleoside-diphosphate-sugar epimerase